MTTTTNPADFIVKVQASLNTNHDQQQCLIYNQARTLMQEMPMSPELLDAMGGQDKEFFHASFNDGELTIKEVAEWQAKLSAIEAQEPVGHFTLAYGRYSQIDPDCWPKGGGNSVPLYAAPAAPAQPVNELVEALEGLMTQYKNQPAIYLDWSKARKALANAKAAQPVNELVEALEKLIKGYVNLLESGREKIIALGGDCDSVGKMVAGSPYLRDANKALANAKAAQPLTKEQVQPAQSKGLFIDLIAAQGPEFVAEMAAIGCEPAQCSYPDCKCPTETPCLKGLEQPAQEMAICKKPCVIGSCECDKEKAGLQVNEARQFGQSSFDASHVSRQTVDFNSTAQPAQGERPMQGLAAYLRCEAGGVFVGHPAHETLMQWASEVDAALLQSNAERVPLSDAWIRERAKQPWIFETVKKWVREIEAAHKITKG